MSEYDRWLDRDLDDYYADDEEEFENLWPDEPSVEPDNDYDNYDGWDDMQ